MTIESSEHGEIMGRTCCVYKLFWMSQQKQKNTICVHNMFSTCFEIAIFMGEAAYCPGSQLVPIFHLPLNGVPKLAAVFKLLQTAASFKNGLSQLWLFQKTVASFENDLSQFWLFQKTAASFENGLSQFWLFQKTAASFETGLSQSVLSEYCSRYCLLSTLVFAC